MKKAEEEEIDIFQSSLVPRHELLDAEEKSELLKNLNISLRQLPRISRNDAAVRSLGARRGDIVRITRRSPVAGEYFYYRVVV